MYTNFHVIHASIMTVIQLLNVLEFLGYWVQASAFHQPKYCSTTMEASYNQDSLHWYLKSMTHHLKVILLTSDHIPDFIVAISSYSHP